MKINSTSSSNAVDLPSTMPPSEPNGFIPTLNSMGYMTSGLDRFSSAFVQFASSAPGPCLDIGAAYGIATMAALSAGAEVVANDIDERHLQILKAKVTEPLQKRLKLAPGNFPHQPAFSAASFGAILVCRVLHFFDGPTIEKSAACLWNWLAPGGKVFVVCDTPYMRTARPFFATYLKRRDEGHPWPGFIEDMAKYFEPARLKQLPPHMNLMDEKTLGGVFGDAGFTIEKLEIFARSDYPKDIQFDGREGIGLIASKP